MRECDNEKTPAGQFPNADNCNVFDQCVNGELISTRCDPNLVVNIYGFCTWPEHVTCAANGKESTLGSSTTQPIGQESITTAEATNNGLN